MKIRTKLIAFSLILSVLPLLALSLLAFDAARSALKQTVEHELISIAEHEMASVQRILSDAANNHLPTWSELGVMQDVLTDDDAGDLQSELLRLKSRYSQFFELLVANEYGEVIASSNTVHKNLDVSDIQPFKLAMSGQNFQGDLLFSEWHLDDVIPLAAPIYASYDTSMVIGVLFGELDWQYFQSSLEQRKLFGGEQGEHRRLVLQSNVGGEVLYTSAGTPLSQMMLQPLLQNQSVGDLVMNGNKQVVATTRSVGTASIKDPGWVLSIIINDDAVYSSVGRLANNLMWLGWLVTCLAALAALLFARATVQPIRELVTGAEQLATGDYSTHLPTSRADEIGSLAKAFFAMREAVLKNEQELIHKTRVSEEAARLKGEFLANMSHEIRTPINGVLGMTELLLNTSLDSKQHRYASTILRSGTSLLSVINDVLDFSKIEAGKLELQDNAFDLRELVEDVVELLAENAHRKGIELTVQLPPDCLTGFSGDASRLRQVLINLLGNAIKFTAHGEVTLRIDVPHVVESEAHVDIRFEVIDTGIGIPVEAQAAIFDSFVQADGSTTRNFGGTGLGLAISARLVNLMGGTIDVVSTVGKGSTFAFNVQLTVLPASVRTALTASDGLAGRRILIVDDNTTNQEILQQHLTHWNAIHETAGDGPQALDSLRRAATSGQPFDLAILDMHMPGMDGLQLAEAIKDDARIADVRLALLSSICDQLDPQTFQSMGIKANLTKPVRQIELYQCLSVLASNRSDDANGEPGSRAVSAAQCEPDASLMTSTGLDEPLSGRILLAEDHPVNQEMMCEMLHILGLDVVLAGNGQQALDALAAEHFDCVLMDCQMPVMDGFRATRKIRQREQQGSCISRTTIIALTANAMEGDRERCLDSGMDEYLSKPVSMIELRSVLASTLKTVVRATVRTDLQEMTSVVDIQSREACETADCIEVSVNVPNKAAESVDETAPALDAAAFSAIEAMCAQATPGFMERLLTTYLDSSSADVQSIQACHAAEDAQGIAKHAHKLKSSSANLGALILAEHCQSLECLARTGFDEASGQQIADITQEHARVISALSAVQSKAA